MKRNKIRPQLRETISKEDITALKRYIAVYLLLIVVFLFGWAVEAFGQSTEDAVFIDGPSTEDVPVKPAPPMHEVGSIFSGSSGVQTPSMDGEILPEPPPADMSMVYYKMILALEERARREGKDSQYYVNIYKRQWELEHPTTTEQAERVSRIIEPLCPDGFEIYEGSGICNQFPSHVSAEQNYYHCALNNYQLYQELTNRQNLSCAKLADGAFSGFLWKPEGDPTARCANGTTILLGKSKQGITKLDIVDMQGDKIVGASYFGLSDDGRPRFCIEGKIGSDFGTFPLNIKYSFDGITECRKVANPSVRED